jgi:predicted Zn finger-like uncharacterized protein
MDAAMVLNYCTLILDIGTAMPLRAACPSCRAKVVVDDAKAGAEVVCHQCGARFTAPSIMAAPPSTFAEAAGYFEDAARGADRGQRRDYGEPGCDSDSAGDLPFSDDLSLPTIVADASGRWRTALVGLGMTFWAMVGIISSLLPFLVLAGVAGSLEKQGAGQPPGPGHLAVIFSILGLLCLMGILLIVIFVGMCLCCAVPPESGAKARAITGVVLALVIVFGAGLAFLLLIVRAAQVQQAGGGPDPVIGAIGAVLAVLFGVLGVLFGAAWMLFHRAVALHFGNRTLARGAIFYVLCHCTLTVIVALLILSTAEAPPGDPSAGLAGGCSVMSGATLVIWYLTILRRTRATIAEHTARVRG